MATPSLAQPSVTWSSAPGSSATQTLAYGSNNAFGNLLTFTGVETGATINSITDSAGNFWQKAKSAVLTWQSELWYCLCAKGGANTITITYSAACSPGGVLEEWTAGAGYVWALDGTPASNTSASNVASLTVGPVTTTGSNDLLLGVIMQNAGGGITAGGGYTQLGAGWVAGYLSVQYLTASAPGSNSTSASWSSSTCSGVFACFSATLTAGLAQPVVESVSATTATPNATYGQNVTAGNTLVAIVSYSAITGTVTCADNLNPGNWTPIGISQSQARTQAWFMLPGTLGGAKPVVTANISISENQAQILIFELWGYCALDQLLIGHAGATTTPSSGAITTHAADFLFSHLQSTNPLGPGTPGWQFQVSSTVNRAWEYINNQPIGTYNATYTSASGAYQCGIASFYITQRDTVAAGATLAPGATTTRAAQDTIGAGAALTVNAGIAQKISATILARAILSLTTTRGILVSTTIGAGARLFAEPGFAAKAAAVIASGASVSATATVIRTQQPFGYTGIARESIYVSLAARLRQTLGLTNVYRKRLELSKWPVNDSPLGMLMQLESDPVRTKLAPTRYIERCVLIVGISQRSNDFQNYIAASDLNGFRDALDYALSRDSPDMWTATLGGTVDYVRPMKTIYHESLQGTVWTGFEAVLEILYTPINFV